MDDNLKMSEELEQIGNHKTFYLSFFTLFNLQIDSTNKINVLESP